jgi:hypothetical protein
MDVVRSWLNYRRLYGWWKPQQLGEQHPHDVDVHEDRHRQLAELIGTYRAGCNA